KEQSKETNTFLRITLTLALTLTLTLSPSARRRRDKDYHGREYEDKRRRKQTITAKRVQHKRLHKQEPQRDREHRPHRKSEELPCSRVAERRKGGQAESAEIT